MIAGASTVTVSEARARIARLEHLNAFISVSDEHGDGPAVAVKDLVDVAGMVTTGGGRILPERPATRDATVVKRVRAAGCVVVGKTNLHEWAYGSTSQNPHFGSVLNPADPGRIAGGSSGGSAVAVATRMCEWAIGTDTAGSLRIPASLCGVVSFKPTYGTIPTTGVIPLSSSLDTVGPLARDVDTVAGAFALMASEPRPEPRESPLVRELRIGRVADHWVDVEGLDSETATAWKSATAEFPPVDIPDRVQASSICTTISMYEASRFHRCWVEQHPDRYGQDILERLREGLLIPESDHRRAMRKRLALRREMAAALSGWDALLAPATAIVAPRVDDKRDVREPMTRFTRPFSASGQPVVTLPLPASGLPIGLQVVGACGGDQALLSVARSLEAHWR
jgi:Asp-tRNA(Asn)/Glu-tRNA(Gln) amidotransferase A subunit family amidase